MAGSQIKAGKDVTLDAARDVNLIASQDTQQTTGKNSSSGGSLGVGSGGAGISVSANANSSKGHEKGNGVWQNETMVDAGNYSMMTAIAASLCGPLIGLTDSDGFGIHFYNSSSAGKTTTQSVASSLYGKPEALKLTWYGTARRWGWRTKPPHTMTR